MSRQTEAQSHLQRLDASGAATAREGVGGGSGGAESAGSSSSSSLIGQVWCRSAAVSLKVYTKPTYGPHSYTRELSHMRHEPLPALNTQVFARLHAWRDETARKVSGRFLYFLRPC